ncbi:hypothetical protein [Mariniflexile fucanivorans]|nr:hypothetical protein [Mariniflexile fucanivorans]
MTTKQQTYQERAEQLVKTIDIAKKVIVNSKSLDDKTRTHFLNWGRDIKNMALNPEPQFKKVASLKYLKNDFLIYWNEEDGKDIEKFWSKLYENGIDFEKKDTIQAVLKRKRIKDIHEYESVIDNIVVAEQMGRINKTQVKVLNQMIGEFEQRQTNKGK